ncbi:hypothetical protein [Rhodanobacter koreensis]
MMHGTYVDAAGVVRDCDLDALKVVAQGDSSINRGWDGLLAFYPPTGALIELRSSPPNIRGDSKGEASEVDDQYAIDAYGVTIEALNKLRSG